jgi:hypothetical protein
MSGYNPYDWERFMRCADAAPSVLNTKPWLFDQAGDDRIELRANWDRHLKAVDPLHRELLISCGAALFNLRMALRVTGHDPVVWLLPDAEIRTTRCPHCGECCGVSDLLASVEIVKRRPRPATLTEERLYEAILRRHTIREPFRHGIRMTMLTELERVARIEKVDARLVHRPDIKAVLKQAAEAAEQLKADTGYHDELSRWTGGAARTGLGVPAVAFGPRPKDAQHSPVRDFGLSWHGDRQSAEFEKHPQLIVLETSTDTPESWLRLGQGLQRLLLTATYYGVQASFLTQGLELQDRRTHHGGAARQPWPWPLRSAQMIIRVGHV